MPINSGHMLFLLLVFFSLYYIKHYLNTVDLSMQTIIYRITLNTLWCCLKAYKPPSLKSCTLSSLRPRCPSRPCAYARECCCSWLRKFSFLSPLSVLASLSLTVCSASFSKQCDWGRHYVLQWPLFVAKARWPERSLLWSHSSILKAKGYEGEARVLGMRPPGNLAGGGFPSWYQEPWRKNRCGS